LQWPLHFLLEEAWLRSRRRVLGGLAERGLQISRDDYESYKTELKTVGCRLLERLAQRIGRPEFVELASERFAGPGSLRFSRRLPFTLAFGHGCTSSLLELAGEQSELSDPAAEGAGLFNLAAVILDRLSDALGRGEDELRAYLPTESLEELFTPRQAVCRISTSPLGRSDADLRVFGAVLAAFFRLAHDLREAGLAPGVWQQLRVDSTAGYEAQMASLNAAVKCTKTRALGIAVGKSAGPFLVFSDLARLATNDHFGADLRTLAESMGTAVGAVDDLADLESDLKTGHLNSVLLRADIGRLEGPDELRAAAQALLDGPAIEQVVAGLMTSVDTVRTTLDAMDVRPTAKAGSTRWLVYHLVDWLT